MPPSQQFQIFKKKTENKGFCIFFLSIQKKQSALCLVPPSSRARLSVEALMRCARGARAVTRDVAAVTPQARDDLRAGPIYLVLGCCKHSALVCLWCVYMQSFLDFAGIAIFIFF
jgi:hypothetical protein